MAAPRSVHFAAVHRILRYIRGTFSRAVLFSVIVFFRVACNYWCRLGLQIGAQLQASLFFGETLHYLGEIKAIDSRSFHCRSGVPCHGTLLDRLYGSVGDFLIAGFIWPNAIHLASNPVFHARVSFLAATTFVENFLMAPTSHYLIFFLLLRLWPMPHLAE